jgi:polar amino acid transport system permease protein
VPGEDGRGGRPPRPVRAPQKTFAKNRVLVALIALGVLGPLAYSIAVAPAMQWNVVWKYLFSSVILNGVKTTIILTVICQGIAILIGTVLATMELAKNPVLVKLARLYLWFFRGVPALVQLLMWYNLALVYPHLFGISTNSIMTPFFAAILGLSIHESAYMSDVIRSGILSVERGQSEAATAIGLTPRQTFFHIVLPQAMRVIVPNTGNRTIGTMKFTSLASFLAVAELLYTVQSIYNVNLEIIPLLLVATIWYLVLVSALSRLQSVLERHYGRSFVDARAVRPFATDGDAETLPELVERP